MWTPSQAQAWVDARPLLIGANYLPAGAVNSTAMWQREGFDLPAIKQELAVAEAAGLNAIRVFLPFIVWEADSEGLKERLDALLAAAWERGVYTLPILFDDCSFQRVEPFLGDQGDPLPHTHNSRWTASPGWQRADDAATHPLLRRYVEDVVGAFGQDPRVYGWDLFNEPGGRPDPERSVWLTEAAFTWARACAPSQPLTACVWTTTDVTQLRTPERRALENSDIVSFHCYESIGAFKALVIQLETLGRPLLCTEWLNRPRGNTFDPHLSFMAQRGIGSFCWGLFAGKTQTFLHYDPAKNPSSDCQDPAIHWQHDLFYPDGTPYDVAEMALLRRLRKTYPARVDAPVRVDERDGSRVAVIGVGVRLENEQDALDLMAQAGYDHDCRKILLPAAALPPAFFDLKTGLLGAVLQKFSNYGVKLAVVGDFSGLRSRSFQAFITESNRGGQVFFLPDEAAALAALHRVP